MKNQNAISFVTGAFAGFIITHLMWRRKVLTVVNEEIKTRCPDAASFDQPLQGAYTRYEPTGEFPQRKQSAGYTVGRHGLNVRNTIDPNMLGCNSANLGCAGCKGKCNDSGVW